MFEVVPPLIIAALVAGLVGYRAARAIARSFQRGLAPEFLKAPVLLVTVVGVFVGCNRIEHEAGSDETNMRASRLRAEAIKAWLVEHGVDNERIAIIPFGEQNPVAPNAQPDGRPNEAGRARNRRVDISTAPRGEGAEGPEKRDSESVVTADSA